MSPFRQFGRHSIATEMETVRNYFISSRPTRKRTDRICESITRNSFSIFERLSLHRICQAFASMKFGALVTLSAASINCKYCMASSGSRAPPLALSLVPIRSAISLKIVADWHVVIRPFGRRLLTSNHTLDTFLSTVLRVSDSLEYAINLVQNSSRNHFRKCRAKLFIHRLIFRRKFVEFRLQIIQIRLKQRMDLTQLRDFIPKILSLASETVHWDLVAAAFPNRQSAAYLFMFSSICRMCKLSTDGISSFSSSDRMANSVRIFDSNALLTQLLNCLTCSSNAERKLFLSSASRSTCAARNSANCFTFVSYAAISARSLSVYSASGSERTKQNGFTGSFLSSSSQLISSVPFIISSSFCCRKFSSKRPPPKSPLFDSFEFPSLV